MQPFVGAGGSGAAVCELTAARWCYYIAPRADDRFTVVPREQRRQSDHGRRRSLTAKVVGSMPHNEGWYHTMDGIHGDMMFGTAGDYLIETAASLTVPDDDYGDLLWWAKQAQP